MKKSMTIVFAALSLGAAVYFLALFFMLVPYYKRGGVASSFILFGTGAVVFAAAFLSTLVTLVRGKSRGSQTGHSTGTST